MSTLSYTNFIKTLPEAVKVELPESLQGIKVRQPWRWLVQFHYGEPRLHYEVSRPRNRDGLELDLHCEARDKELNRYLLFGFRHHLFEIKDTLGESIEAEMWDKGWTKIYEVYPYETLDEEFQKAGGRRMAEIIVCLHPIFVQLRNDVARIHR